MINSAGVIRGSERLTAPEKITYQSFDSLLIHAYLYSPRSRKGGKKYQGLLFIHSGPTN